MEKAESGAGHNQFAESDRKFWLKALGVAAAIVLGIGACSWASSSGDATSGTSQGEAEIACERAIEAQAGSSARLSYTTKTEQGGGAFALYGDITTDDAEGKFHCSVTGALGDGDARASVEFYD